MPRILLVDDDKEKVRRVLEIACHMPGITLDVDVAYTTYDAKVLLAKITYDLLILDIALPERAELPVSPDAGISLLREVCERRAFNKPNQIVGLTAYTEALDQAAPLFQQELWYVIHYDRTSTEWIEQLQRKFRYLALAEGNRQALEHGCDLCVLAALPSPEYSALLNLPWKWAVLQPENEVAVFHRGSFENAGATRHVIAGCAARVGMPAAAILATKLIFNFRPRFLAMVGIAAGIRGTCGFGDILVADPTWDYGSGKWSTSGSNTLFEAAPHQVPLQSGIRSRLQLMAQESRIFDEIRSAWSGPKPDTVLKMLIGPMASGAAVRADGRVAGEVKAQHRQTLGIEMEAYGVMAAAHDAPLPEVSAFVLKSVCDFADETKSDVYQAYAAYTSVQSLQRFAERFLPF